MEQLPRGANFRRAKMLWEIGLHIAGDPKEPYFGNRDICITVGSGSGENYRPWLRLSSGSQYCESPHRLIRGVFTCEVIWKWPRTVVNPSSMLHGPPPL